ncbi:FxsA family protein [Halobium salinum]|uniref:FxsA family protein n=1 Tax=Halobium salinum TaxID=1364940 RepID=A0ABD5P8Z9_9EURY|nr:FxsA family protein [Halobium salinum]
MKPRYLIALLLLIPLADSLALVALAGFVLDPLVVVALVVLTGLIGMLLVRAEGRHTMRKLERKLSSGQLPTDQLIDGGMLIAAGAFLLTPGVVTDLIGFLFAVPVTRYPIREVVKRYVAKPYLDRKMDGFVSGGTWTGGFPKQETYDVDPNSYRFDRDEESESN